MKILFIMRHEGYVRNYESVIVELAKKGHTIYIGLLTPPNKIVDDMKLRELKNSFPHITYDRLPELEDNFWSPLASLLRWILDYTRYLYPVYREAPKLRERIGKRLPQVMLDMFDRYASLKSERLDRIQRLLRRVERLIPVRKELLELYRDLSPDVVLFTPIIDAGSGLIDYLKAAKKMGLRTALCVASWDNLTNKGLIQIEPDIVIVWNEFQKEEAVELHGIDPSKVVVTGAQLFDQWFVMKPSTTRIEFCKKVGLRHDKPFILYVCSSVFVARNEVVFIKEYIKALRESGRPELEAMGILIRPHPNNIKQWMDVDVNTLGDNVSLWPPHGAVPINEATRKDYFDSLYHSTAVVGINTSALIEAGIVGRPVYTVLDKRFVYTQHGTLHFHYLVKGGLLTTASTLEEHIEQLSHLVIGDTEKENTIKAFVKEFVRPHGLDVPATPLVIDAIENLLYVPTSVAEKVEAGYPVRALGLPLAVIARFLRRLYPEKKMKRVVDAEVTNKEFKTVGAIVPMKKVKSKGSAPIKMDKLKKIRKIKTG